MAIQIPPKLIDFILLGPEDDRRQLQDSPILGDVWLAFARAPADRLELLITPYKEHAAGKVATILSRCLKAEKDAAVAYLQGIVAARLSFREVLCFVAPMTYWWRDKRISRELAAYKSNPGKIKQELAGLLNAAVAWPETESGSAMQDIGAPVRYIALAGLLLWAEKQGDDKRTAAPPVDLRERLLNDAVHGAIIEQLRNAFKDLHEPNSKEQQSLVWHVARNRTASPALRQSVPAVKADSARSLFKVDCKDIVWAVVDSGIDATHPAFQDEEGQSRVKRAFDFTRIREIVSLDNTRPDRAKERIRALLHKDLRHAPAPKKALANLIRLAEDAEAERSISWELVEELVEIKPGTPPPSNHGTHVAGIIGGSRDGGAAKRRTKARQAAAIDKDDDRADGICPDIRLYDFRVLAPTLKETEFAIIAALQYIRYINERNSFMTIHGANLSLSIRHAVRNYACGRTPVCNECERLVNSGVAVIAAAGNRGYQNFETAEGVQYEGYAAFSVTDPGNADGVITVGATHRNWPHTYGVSFFSSRGPTGDGRMKPDLVAPGERIRGPLPGNEWGDLDGTSMAAPHVSGAAAMLMARYTELIGQPRRIKRILCDSATDLGREKSFQGRGMLDVLRAFQSV